jgi:hypothetical protein
VGTCGYWWVTQWTAWARVLTPLVFTLDQAARLCVIKLPNGSHREMSGSYFGWRSAKLHGMKTSRLFLILVACSLPLAVSAQWQWLDSSGKKVFSDRPPPSDVPEKNIIRQPRGSARLEALPVASAASAAARPASTPRVSGKDSDLEAKKKQADQDVAAKKKAEEDKLAADRASNCAAANSSLVGLQSGRRIQRTNASGELEYLGDDARVAETKRMQDVIARDCGAGTASAR